MLQLEIIGNLGHDAGVKQINGKDYVSFDVAHEERNGNDKTTVWVSVLWYGNGGNLKQYLRTGARVFVRGRMSVRLYTSQKTGQVNYSVSVFATEVQMCEFAKGQADQSQSPTSGQQVGNFQDGDPFIRGAKAMQTPVPPATLPHNSPTTVEDEEDLPF